MNWKEQEEAIRLLRIIAATGVTTMIPFDDPRYDTGEYRHRISIIPTVTFEAIQEFLGGIGA